MQLELADDRKMPLDADSSSGIQAQFEPEIVAKGLPGLPRVKRLIGFNYCPHRDSQRGHRAD